MTNHGGFRAGDQVDVKFRSQWLKGRWIILDFNLMMVQIHHANKEDQPVWISIFRVRKPNIRI